MSVAGRIADVRTRIERAAVAAGRAPAEVTLVAVVKHQPLDAVIAALDAGVVDLGDNTVQSLVHFASALADRGRVVRWHFIGRLQRNKINALVPWVHLVHTVDRLELAQALAARTPAAGLAVLIQVNIGREPQKGGVEPDGAVALARGVAALPSLRLEGLMAIPPAGEGAASHFAALARLGAEVGVALGRSTPLSLSMGMSEDFETAIAHGATLVRVGTGIFGERSPRA